LGTGTYSTKPDFREVTLFEMEVLEALARNDPPLQSGPITLRPVDHRRNLTVSGVPLHRLVGQHFRVGTAVLFGGRLNFPCKYLQKLLSLPVYLPLYNRSGLNCRIEKAGIVHAGDLVEPA
jgi:MOSC domain-containing protein YiiM